MVSDEQITDIVRRIVEAVEPVRIILFGSTARGEEGPFSDVDVLVVVNEGAHRRKSAQLIYRRLQGVGIAVDVVVATPLDLEQYHDSPGLIYRQAIREGKELYAA
ncbi:MAG: nucleotidyltransferase domain-containing protein [Armatimonadota bacterium]